MECQYSCLGSIIVFVSRIGAHARKVSRKAAVLRRMHGKPEDAMGSGWLLAATFSPCGFGTQIHQYWQPLPSMLEASTTLGLELVKKQEKW